MSVKHWVILSIGLNAMLAVGVVSQRTKLPAVEASVPSSSVAQSAPAKQAKEKPVTAEPEVVTVPGKPFSWAEVEAADYKVYIANLRAIGCPEETIQDIIYNDVSKLYARKMRELGDYGERVKEYWKPRDYSYSSYAQQRALEKEKHELLIELLGVDPEKLRRERQGYPDYEALKYPFLTEEKRKQAMDIWEKYTAQEQGLYQKYRNYYGEEREAEMAEIKKAKDAEMAKVLSPDELFEWQLRSSGVASSMQWQLQAFEPSEQEFRAMFKIEDQWQDTMGNRGPDPDDAEAQKKWQEASKLRQDEMKKILGGERYKEYARAQDYQYQQLYRMLGRTGDGTAKATANKVYAMKEEAEAQSRKVRSDQSLSPAQRQQALKEIQELTQKSVQAAIGEKNYKRYQGGAGYWLRNIGR